MKKIILFLFCLSAAISSFAQTEVTLNVQVNPPYSPNINNYNNFLNQMIMTVQNNTSQTLNLRFICTVTNLTEGWYFRLKNDIPVQPYTLQANDFQTITGNDGNQVFGSSNINDYETNVTEAIKTNVALTGILPEGNYQLCVQAFDYDQPGVALSSPQTGCAVFPITFIQPPLLIQPICGNTVQAMDPQNLIINWMPVTGNLSGGIISYDLYMVLVPNGINPQDAMDGAVQAGAGIFIFHQAQINGNQFIYGTMFPPLDSGTYAIQVIASNPTGTLTFANHGMSQVCSFVYKKDAAPTGITAPVVVPVSGITCESCKTVVPTDAVNASGPANGSTIQFGNQQIKVLSVTTTGGKSSGTGILHFLQVPIRVAFSDVTVNNSNVVMSGQAAAIQKTGIDIFPTTTAPGLGPVTLSPAQVANLGDFISSSSTQLVSALKGSANAAGFELPLGLDKNILGVKTVIAITSLHLTPSSSAFDAATLVELPDMSTRVALGAKNMCIKDNGICGDGVLYLAQDLKLPVMTLKGAQYPADSGTFVQFKDDGFEKLRVKAEYEFSTDLISLKSIANGTVKATLIGEGKSWSDWTASVILPPFVVKGAEDLSFVLDVPAIYDHSSLSNPIGVPSTLASSVTWNGFYMPKLKMTLPSVIKSLATGSVSASVTDLVIDGDGVSGSINANNVLTLGNGSLDSWYYSIDRIYATFERNSFKDAGMNGKLILPISDNTDQNQLDYHSTLSSPSGKIEFQFVIQPKNNIGVPIWYSQLTIDNTSNIKVEYVGDSLKATADLNGKMDIVINNIADVGVNVKFKLMEIEHLKLMTYSPYVSLDKWKAGFASPQKDVDGFDISLKKIELTSETTPEGKLIGPKFEIGMSLSSIEAAPSATFGLKILGKPGLKNGRPSWEFKKCEPTKIAVGGQLGPARVDGSLEFVKNDPEWHDYMKGELSVAVANLLSVKCRGMFGNKVTATEDYNYFYLDANVTLPVPLPISVLPAPPISVFGMGMGLYYHLSVEKNTRGPEALLAAVSSDLTNKYKPDPHAAGFNGNVVLGMSDGTTMMGRCSIETEVNIENFGLNKIAFKGEVFTMCEPGNMTNSIGKGIMELKFDFANKVFDLLAVHTIEAKLGGITLKKVYGTLDLHIAPKSAFDVDWHLKIGEPSKPCLMNPFDIFPPPYSLLNYAFTGHGYFMTGNDIPLGIPLNEHVREAFGNSPFSDQKRGTGDLITGKAIVFGAGMDLPKIDENFLCFYLKFEAGIGFDIKFDRMTTECKAAVGTPGFNGYYANGQFYTYATFDFGLDVDLWFYHGRVSAGSSYFKGGFRAGLPNPTWFKGTVSAGFSVLADQITGTMNFQIAVGEECIAARSPFGDGLPIISEILPGNMTLPQKDGIEVDQGISVGFNYPVEREFTITDKKDTGEPINRSFIIHIDYFNLVEVAIDKIVLSKDDNQLKTWADGNKSLMLFPKTSYTPKVDHRIDLKVTAYETTGGGETKCKTSSQPGAPDMTEQKAAYFKTAGCPETLEGKVLSSYPFPGQRFLLQDENDKNGSLILPLDYTCMSDPKYDLMVKFTSYKGETEIETQTVEATFSDAKLHFKLPVLPNGALVKAVAVKKLKRVVIDGGDFMYDSESPIAKYLDFAVLSNKTEDVSNNIFMKKASAGSKRGSTEIRLYTYYFMTSEYNTLAQKLGGMSSTVKTSGINTSDQLQDMEMKIPIHEPFDIYDLYGQNYNLSLYAPNPSSQFSNPPILDIREGDTYDGWRGNFVKPYFNNYFNLGQSNFPQWGDIDLSWMVDLAKYYGNDTQDCFLNPVTFSRKYPPLMPLVWDDISKLLPHIEIPEGMIMAKFSPVTH